MIIAELAAAIDRRVPVVLATVVRTRRSVPRRPGSKMLVYADGRTSGTIGGGEMESRVIDAAAGVLADGRPRVVGYELVDPGRGDVGVCGGEVEIYLEPFMPTPTVYVIGAGHVGRAVEELARWLEFRTVVWDDRPEMVAGLDGAGAVGSGPLEALLSEHPPGPDDAVVVVTRNVALDLEILPLLVATPVRYIGVMGSRRRWETTRDGLLAAGVEPARLDRVRTPIGLEIGAETPAEIALSILAEVLEVRRGR